MKTHIQLEATSQIRRQKRFSYIDTYQTPSGYSIKVRTGCLGQIGKIFFYFFKCEEACQKKLRQILRRRLNPGRGALYVYRVKSSSLTPKSLEKLVAQKRRLKAHLKDNYVCPYKNFFIIETSRNRSNDQLSKISSVDQQETLICKLSYLKRLEFIEHRL